MKIRRGVFSNAKLNGYIRVELDWRSNDDPNSVPSHQQTSVANAQPTQFKHLRRLPLFPAFLCARERLLVSRIPVFTARKTSFASTDAAPQPHASHPRFVPSLSVFHATECQFSDDFSQLALKVTTTFGLSGWVTASYADALIPVDDPRAQVWDHRVYVQNVAPKSGKWMGELPVRAAPSLQAQRLGTLAPFEIVRARARKLVKDQVWLQIEYVSRPEAAASGTVSVGSEDNQTVEAPGDTDASKGASEDDSAAPAVVTDAWIIERNVNTGERVAVPWGGPSFDSSAESDDDRAERWYRNVYARRPLPLRQSPELAADVVGQLEPGAVFASSVRVLNAHGRMWIRVPLAPTDAQNPQDAKAFGFAIQSNAKTNRCMLQEIAPPGKMAPPQLFHVSPPPTTTASGNSSDGAESSDCHAPHVLAHASPAASSKALFAIRSGAVVRAVGTLFAPTERQLWLQVLATEIDASMRKALPNVVLSDDEQQQNVVYVAVASGVASVAHAIASRQVEKVANPHTAHADETKRASARVVFSGRASKLFGSQLMQPSTLDLPALEKKTASDGHNRVAAAAGETQDPAQQLKDEINVWTRESERLSVAMTAVRSGAAQLRACVARPFRSCLAKKDAMRKYEQLYQDDDDDDLEYGGRGQTGRPYERVTEFQV